MKNIRINVAFDINFTWGKSFLAAFEEIKDVSYHITLLASQNLFDDDDELFLWYGSPTKGV